LVERELDLGGLGPRSAGEPEEAFATARMMPVRTARANRMMKMVMRSSITARIMGGANRNPK